jgi:hypothetical protein
MRSSPAAGGIPVVRPAARATSTIRQFAPRQIGSAQTPSDRQWKQA